MCGFNEQILSKKTAEKISDYECIWQVTCVKMTSFVYNISHCSMWRKLVSFIFKNLPNGYRLIVCVGVCVCVFISCYAQTLLIEDVTNSIKTQWCILHLDSSLNFIYCSKNRMETIWHKNRFDYHAWNLYHIWMHLFTCEDYWPLTFHELVLHVWMIVGRKNSAHIMKWNM